MSNKLSALLEAVLSRQYGGVKQALAAAIDVSGSRLGRVLQGEFSLSVISCLKLARAAGLSPSMVLQDAGKAEVAELLEGLYGSAVAPLPNSEKELLERWRRLPPKSQKVLRSLIDDLNRTASTKKRERTA